MSGFRYEPQRPDAYTAAMVAYWLGPAPDWDGPARLSGQGRLRAVGLRALADAAADPADASELHNWERLAMAGCPARELLRVTPTLMAAAEWARLMASRTYAVSGG